MTKPDKPPRSRKGRPCPTCGVGWDTDGDCARCGPKRRTPTTVRQHQKRDQEIKHRG